MPKLDSKQIIATLIANRLFTYTWPFNQFLNPN